MFLPTDDPAAADDDEDDKYKNERDEGKGSKDFITIFGSEQNRVVPCRNCNYLDRSIKDTTAEVAELVLNWKVSSVFILVMVNYDEH